MDSEPQSIVTLLGRWRAGDAAAGKDLMESVYGELRRLAAHYLQAERADHTLQPTALVHELYIKLFSSEPPQFQNRGHFLAVAARQIRHIIVDYARSRQALKRGGVPLRISMEDAPDIGVALDSRVLDLDFALGRLEQLDPRAAQVVELRYFGGLTESEIAETLGISIATVKRDWDFARAWLMKEIE